MASGVCHTDLHAADGDWPVKPTLPFIPGHEGAGIVAALGAGVTGLKEGDPVGIAWLHDACGACEYCITGWETLCAAQHNSGYSVNGTFAEYAIGSAAYVGRLPDRSGLRRAGADPLRRRHDLQGHQGDRGAAGRVDRDLGHRRARARRRAVRQGHGAARRRGRRDRGEARARPRARRRCRRERGGTGCRCADVSSRRTAARMASWSPRCRSRRFRPGAADGAAQGHREPRRPAARRVPDAHLRRRAEAHHDPRLDRRHTRQDLAEALAFAAEARCERTSIAHNWQM